MISTEKTQTAGSIVRATAILQCLSEDIHTVTDIARKCSLSKSTVHRVLKLLEQSNLVMEDNINRRYFLGPLIQQLTANLITTHQRLILGAIDDMKHLSNVSRETVAMDILVGIQYYSLHEIPSQHDLKVTQESKKIGPLYTGMYTGASVKALLSLLDDKRLGIFLDNINISPETERTVTDKVLLMKQIKEIRRDGYTITRGERIPGVICLSAPVKNYILPVSLVLVGPENRIQPRLKVYTGELKASAACISASIAGIFGETVNYQNAGR